MCPPPPPPRTAPHCTVSPVRAVRCSARRPPDSQSAHPRGAALTGEGVSALISGKTHQCRRIEEPARCSNCSTVSPGVSLEHLNLGDLFRNR